MVAVFALEPKTYNSFINFLWFHSKKCILLTRPSLNLVKRSTRNLYQSYLYPHSLFFQPISLIVSDLKSAVSYALPQNGFGLQRKTDSNMPNGIYTLSDFRCEFRLLMVVFWAFFLLLPSVTVLGSHNEKLPLCLFTSSSSLNVTLVRDESPARKKTKTLFIFLSQIFPS